MSKCACKAEIFFIGMGETEYRVVRCDRCKKRDELWPELVKWIDGTKHACDYEAAIKLLSRAKEVT